MYKTKDTAIGHLAAGENFKNKVFDLFRGDKEVVLTAISNDGRALCFASAEIKELVCETSNPAAKLQSAIDKEKLEAKMATKGIKLNQGQERNFGSAL